jgi:uncharacterized protein YodC (DUF2158 family)
MENELKVGDVVAFKANKDIKLVVSGIGKDGFALLRYFDAVTSEFKKVEMPLVCFEKIEQ